MALEDIRNDRLKKLEILKEKGVDPYPASSGRTTTIAALLSDFDAQLGTQTTIAGRVMSRREHGGSIFFDVYDGTGTIQGYCKEDVLAKDSFDLFAQTVDVGDFIDLAGEVGTTKRGERTITASSWTMLAKSLRSLPEKWEGLKDPEEKLRKRYLDILSNPDLKELFEKKAKFWEVTRSFLKERGFLEVETPSLEVTTGGAEARPFKTHHNDFDLDVFLRISIGELWEKRLMAAGFSRVFEIGRAYRNEGSSQEHVQEFTNMEFYAAYVSFEEGKKMIQDLYRTLATEVFGTTKFTTRGHTFDLADDWKDIDYCSTIHDMTGVHPLETSEGDIEAKLKELKIQYEGTTRERLVDSLWKYCRKNISGPAFLVNHPKLVAPLSRENAKDPRLTEMFQVIIAGSEIGRAHAELNDPLDQKERFDAQQKLIERGDEEAMMPDQEFVEMLEYGMPPTFGFGFGERFFSYLPDKPIRETQIFPLMRPKQE